MKRFTLLLAALAVSMLPGASAARSSPPASPATPAAPNAAEIQARIESISARLHPQTGDIRIPAANAVLHLGRDYYFLPADEARIVLTEAWRNPPDATTGVLGMVFPAGRTFADDTWGAVITYDPSGYVSDSDAASADYDELLQQIQGTEPEVNQRRSSQGYPTQHLVGWAQPPVYDSRTHSVVWAQNFLVTGDSENSLNYDIRMLGRSGVLSLNMVTTMGKLAETRQAAQRFAAAVEFTPGSRYADYQPGTDRVAEYGVAGLVAAGIGAVAVKKAGLLILILAFLKKAGIFIVVGIGLLWTRIRRLFGHRGADDESYYYEAPPPVEPMATAQADAPAAPTPDGEPPPPERTG